MHLSESIVTRFVETAKSVTAYRTGKFYAHVHNSRQEMWKNQYKPIGLFLIFFMIFNRLSVLLEKIVA